MDQTQTQTQTQTQCEPEPADEPAEVAPSEPQTPTTTPHTPTTTSHAPSETDSTQPTTPSSAAPVRIPAQQQLQSKIPKPPVPLVPVVPILPQSPSTPRNLSKDGRRPSSDTSITPTSSAILSAEGPATNTMQEASTGAIPSPSSVHGSEEPATIVSPPCAPPKSWADLVRSKTQPRAGSVQEGPVSRAISKSESLVDVLNSLGANVDHYSEKIAFLETRGLVNTGNMCYMNSVRFRFKCQNFPHPL